MDAGRIEGGMQLAAIWRYPVKSMAGEPLESAVLDADGIQGDRVVHVEDRRSRVVTARKKPALLGHRATLGKGGEPLVDGRPWRDPEVAAEVEIAAGEGATLQRYDGVERFDVLPLLVATDGALAAFGRDPRRLRPNLVIGGVPGLAERDWPGRRIAVGECLIAVAQLRQRCIMTTYDPDTQEKDVEVLLGIQREFGGAIALDCAVERGGTIRLGDPVRLL